MALEQLLSVEAVADYLGIHRITVYRLLERGELASVRAGRAHRIPESSLRAYVDRQAAGVGA